MLRKTMSNTWSRRDFLKTASAATLSALAASASYPNLLRADTTNPQDKLTPTADAVIVLWMAGGMAHTETFDPKKYTPFEKGLSPSKVLSTVPGTHWDEEKGLDEHQYIVPGAGGVGEILNNAWV